MVGTGGTAVTVVACCLAWREQDVTGRSASPRLASGQVRDRRPRQDMFRRPHTQGAAMAVIRFDPLRDPLERLSSMAATGTRAPLAMPMDVYRAGDGSYHVEADLPRRGPGQRRGHCRAQHLDDPGERTPHYGDSEQVIVAERPQGSLYPAAVPRRGRGLGEPHRQLRRRCPARDHPPLAQDPGSPDRDHPCARRQPAPSPGAQLSRVGRPPAARAEHPPDLGGARLARHPGRAWSGRQRTTSWQPGGCRRPCHV